MTDSSCATSAHSSIGTSDRWAALGSTHGRPGEGAVVRLAGTGQTRPDQPHRQVGLGRPGGRPPAGRFGRCSSRLGGGLGQGELDRDP
eukprot:14952288-Alexandrium_andersonii.AAC.1